MSNAVPANLIYFSPPVDGSRPYTSINADPATGERRRNWVPDQHIVSVENIRGNEKAYTLDTAGFQIVKRAAKHTAFDSENAIKAEYYPESAALLKEITGASRVLFFDHTVRRHRPGVAEADDTMRQPVAQVHVDQTPGSATARVYRHLPPSEAEFLVKKRFQIINIWRPISHSAIDYPLALCDYRTVDPQRDLVPVALIYPDKEGETFGVRYNEAHKWKYQRQMGVDEIVLIKCYDSSKEEGVAVFTPHTGFKDPTASEDAPRRESIELRALVFYD